MLNFGSKIPIWVLFGQNLKKASITILKISTFEFFKMQSFMLKKKINFGPKLLYLGIFRQEYEKTIVLFEINILEFVIMQKFMQTNFYFLNRNVIFEISGFVKMQSFMLKIKINKLGR